MMHGRFTMYGINMTLFLTLVLCVLAAFLLAAVAVSLNNRPKPEPVRIFARLPKRNR